jgi:general secretion pathway protein A
LPSLEERISAKALLRAYTAEETAAYVRHRLTAAGATRDLFSPDAVEALHYLGRGIPRQINRLGDLALVVGFADRLPRITAREIETISEELVAVGADL